mmetsp:Transcript_73117/g.156656  ORF Transcript_73117/g.156656 Transcript_73117/m.156656 type:complete len:451 (-) Transcript_73117:18-1370(-)
MGPVNCKDCTRDLGDDYFEPAPGSPFPRVLHIESPNGQQSSAGTYLLVEDVMPNGWPLWCKTGNGRKGDRFLYSSLCGTWNVGGHGAKAKEFHCHDFHIYCPTRHEGRLPHRVTGVWQRTDGKDFFADPAIRVFATVVAEELQRSAINFWPTFATASKPATVAARARPVGLEPVVERPRAMAVPLVAALWQRHWPDAEKSGQRPLRGSDGTMTSSWGDAPTALPATARATELERKAGLGTISPGAVSTAPSQEPSWQWSQEESPSGLDRCVPNAGESQVSPDELSRRLAQVLVQRLSSETPSAPTTPSSAQSAPSAPATPRLVTPGGREAAHEQAAQRMPMVFEDEHIGRRCCASKAKSPVSLEVSFWPSVVDRRKPVKFTFTRRPIGIEFDAGVVSGFAPTSVAWEMGVKKGMMLKAINGSDIARMKHEDVYRLLAEKCKLLASPPGDR